MKFDQEKYFSSKIILKIRQRDLFFFFKKALYEAKPIGQ